MILDHMSTKMVHLFNGMVWSDAENGFPAARARSGSTEAPLSRPSGKMVRPSRKMFHLVMEMDHLIMEMVHLIMEMVHLSSGK